MAKASDCDFGCGTHAQHHGVMNGPDFRAHPDNGRKEGGYGDVLQDHSTRGAAHPKHHSQGKLRAQMNPDHGPHRGAGRHA